MRRFFRAQRDEDYSQIQYLTAKCTRLAHDKAVLDRDFLLSIEREKKLHNDLEVVATRLLHQEQANTELRIKQNQLISRIHQQQYLVDLLQQRLILLAEDSSRHTEVLQQVGSELLCVQSSEGKLVGLVEELHAEAQHRAALTESLEMELRSKTVELKELQDINKTLTEELKDLRRAHQEEVREAQQENEGSLRKLQETAEQFEGLCQQQRSWMCCVKRFKDSLMEERKALLRQVSMLETKAEDLKRSSRADGLTQNLLCPLLAPDRSGSGVTSWDADAATDLEAQVEKSNLLYEELCSRVRKRFVDGHVQQP
ncbi:hyaluronan-mediated motility receptor [Channa argus]|uniref:hyaluronan-mediated motility receptor n=1 Tax=Channa argus TaxID=215402 RepID=UPI00351FFF9C